MPTGPDLPCVELTTLVTDYLDRELPLEERARFEEHLADCPGCQRYLEQIRTTVSLLARMPAQALSEPVRERLLAAFREQRDGSGAASP
jgi:anti-sigma factor RsiW